MHNLDILFINPSSAQKAYQKLAETYSAIEPPTWSLLLAKSLSLSCRVDILDCDALRISDEKAVEEIEYLKPKLVCFVVYGHYGQMLRSCPQMHLQTERLVEISYQAHDQTS